MAIIPFSGRVLVKPLENEPTKGGILIAGVEEELRSGIVVEVGPYAQHVRKNDIVLFANTAGSKVDHDDEPHLLLKTDDIVARVQ